MKSFRAGEIVEHAIRSQNINISELSRRMKINRRTLYNWFHQDQLDIEVIFTIGHMINHDFSDEFKDEFLRSGFRCANEHTAHQPTDIDPAQESNYYWMQKYISLLEEHTALLQMIKVSGQPTDKKINY